MQRELSHLNFVRDIFEDLIERLVGMSYEENIFVLQPCRDNALYLLKLLDEMLINERGHKFLVFFFFFHVMVVRFSLFLICSKTFEINYE